jgi:hypothetical protein
MSSECQGANERLPAFKLRWGEVDIIFPVLSNLVPAHRGAGGIAGAREG